MLGIIFEDFYVCVSLIFKDKLKDNYSIFQGISYYSLASQWLVDFASGLVDFVNY